MAKEAVRGTFSELDKALSLDEIAAPDKAEMVHARQGSKVSSNLKREERLFVLSELARGNTPIGIQRKFKWRYKRLLKTTTVSYYANAFRKQIVAIRVLIEEKRSALRATYPLVTITGRLLELHDIYFYYKKRKMIPEAERVLGKIRKEVESYRKKHDPFPSEPVEVSEKEVSEAAEKATEHSARLGQSCVKGIKEGWTGDAVQERVNEEFEDQLPDGFAIEMDELIDDIGEEVSEEIEEQFPDEEPELEHLGHSAWQNPAPKEEGE